VTQPLRVAGETNVGRVRTTNEDALVVEPGAGLYAVFDGMGGANAGDVASRTAADAVRDVVLRNPQIDPRALLDSAIQAASASIFHAAAAHREHHGMGTTVVAAIVVSPERVVIGHVGDSRAYLLRGGRLQALTRDHTIVEDLVDRGLLPPEEAERHPYKNVLSRNLGSRPDARVDLNDVVLRPGDRLLLCSDGLYGYASAEAIQYLLGSGDDPQHVARDLIDLAMRGGGGDNVSTIVIEVPAPAPTSGEVVRTAGAMQWWGQRARFLAAAKERGLARNPMVRGLPPDEALELVALSLCQAIYHDLEKATGVNVWTFAQNLAGGWFERGGEFGPVRAMVDILGASARIVLDELREREPAVGFLVDVAVSRALVVAELALGGLLAERLRQVDEHLIELHRTLPVADPSGMTAPVSATAVRTDEIPLGDSGERFIDRPTIPFLRPERSVTNPGVSAELLGAIGKVITIARARTAPRQELQKQVLAALETIATDSAGSFGAAVIAARDLYGVRSVDEQGVMPLFDALDHARILVAAGVQQVQLTPVVRTRSMRALSYAHQRLVSACTGLVLEAVAPYGERLGEVQKVTGEMRAQVEKAERRRADLEHKFATIVDPELPWGSRGETEW
jgi:protein phosphatase